ncbi:hypothetical protein N7517_005708 [Penicillium concentricum]|uniref:Uncharacterized protein n=1 Tax=Penicillium concentricum TaxID=293559 RepID=A0A9W9S7W9_9EURO|nr:uncharacterized protein N7517_005708 [Penicillium concentricum]KAJ5373702.1 hypothetical protein N7517_005708 [Penicillium concentricum]
METCTPTIPLGPVPRYLDSRKWTLGSGRSPDHDRITNRLRESFTANRIGVKVNMRKIGGGKRENQGNCTTEDRLYAEVCLNTVKDIVVNCLLSNYIMFEIASLHHFHNREVKRSKELRKG